MKRFETTTKLALALMAPALTAFAVVGCEQPAEDTTMTPAPAATDTETDGTMTTPAKPMTPAPAE